MEYVSFIDTIGDFESAAKLKLLFFETGSMVRRIAGRGTFPRWTRTARAGPLAARNQTFCVQTQERPENLRPLSIECRSCYAAAIT